MRRRVTVLAVLALAIALAGCMGGDEAPDDAGETAMGEDDDATLQAPSWEVGDWWTWDTDQQGEVTYVVTGEDGGDWIVDTTNEGVAFFDARFPVSTLGEIRKSDLAGSQADQRVAFFDWPLEAEKTWTTTWDDVERTIRVRSVGDTVAELDATQDGRLAVQYAYDGEAESFRTLRFLDENGTETFGMELADHGSDFSGTPIRWQLDQAVDEEGTFGVEPESFGFGFEVPEDATDLWLSFQLACPSGTYNFGFSPNEQDGGDSGYGSSDTCPAEADLEEPVVEDPDPGSYRGGFTASSPEADGEYSITLYVRTLVEVPVGEG